MGERAAPGSARAYLPGDGGGWGGLGGRLLILLLWDFPEEQNTGQSEEYVLRGRRIQNRFSHQLVGESPSHLLHMRPRSPGLCSWRLSAWPGAKLQDEKATRRGKKVMRNIQIRVSVSSEGRRDDCDGV